MAQYFALHPATFKLDGGAMFGIIPKPLWEKQIPADELNRIHLSLRVLCIKTDTRVILIDTGIGDYHDAKFADRFAIQGRANPLVEVVQQELNIPPQAVTDLVVTHLHFDHVGGLGDQKAQFIFPNARLHLHRAHYQYALSPTIRDAGSFQSEYFRPVIEALAVAQRIVWHDGERGVLLNDGAYTLNFRTSHGHTPWLMHPFDDKFIYMADLVPTSAHVPLAWVMGYDIAPGVSTQDKASFYHDIAAQNLVMIFEHDIGCAGARISWDGKAATITERLSSSGKKLEPLVL